MIEYARSVSRFPNAENSKKKGIAINMEVVDPNVMPRISNWKIGTTFRSLLWEVW